MGMMRWTAPSPDTPRHVTIIGSTGSVGQSTADLIARAPDSYRVEALVAGNSVEALAEQARRLKAKLAVVANPQRYRALKDALAGTSIEAAAGPEAVIEAASRPAEWVMAAVVGYAGLAPTLVAARRGAMVALGQQGGAGLRRPSADRRDHRVGQRSPAGRFWSTTPSSRCSTPTSAHRSIG